MAVKRTTVVYRYVYVVQIMLDNNNIEIISMKAGKDPKPFVFNENDVY